MVNPDPSVTESVFGGIYKDKSIFVTGHTGFKGSWLCLWLGALGARVVGYSLDPPSSPCMFEAAEISRDITSIKGDIRDFDHLCSAMQDARPEVVFHLAAQSLVRRSYRNPRLTFETNVQGTVNVLEAVRNTSGVRVCVNITSDKCYENKEWVYSYRENDPMGGYDPYSASKGCAEIAASAYLKSFLHQDKPESGGVSLVSVRAGNVIGGGDWAEDRIIPDCVRSLSRGLPIPIRNPTAVRPWQHVLDPLSAYLWIASILCRNPFSLDYAWNIGSSRADSLTVRQVVEAAIEVWGQGSWQDRSDTHAAHEANVLRLDCSKASTLLNWRSCYDQIESVEATIQWYYNFYRNTNFSPRKYTLSQIEDFVRKAKTARIPWANGTP